MDMESKIIQTSFNFDPLTVKRAYIFNTDVEIHINNNFDPLNSSF